MFQDKKKYVWVLVMALILVGGSVWGVEINPNLPGGNEGNADKPNPVGVIGNLYQFALMIGGLLAFAVIVYGSIQYATAGGNPTKQSDAKDRIVQALIGLLLLVGGGIVLATIRPGFSVDEGGFTIPGIPGLKGVTPAGGGVPQCTTNEEANGWCIITAKADGGHCNNGQIVCCLNPAC